MHFLSVKLLTLYSLSILTNHNTCALVKGSDLKLHMLARLSLNWFLIW